MTSRAKLVALLHLKILADALDPQHLEPVLLSCTTADQLSPVPKKKRRVFVFVERESRAVRQARLLGRGGARDHVPGGVGGAHNYKNGTGCAPEIFPWLISFVPHLQQRWQKEAPETTKI